ncbi:hypothetical protein, partial [Leptospira interrogans]|uniref:hypothetical protein n=1 Tax=Leptospira interrogans TaxID=173 RepID=UPI001D1592D9
LLKKSTPHHCVNKKREKKHLPTIYHNNQNKNLQQKKKFPPIAASYKSPLSFPPDTPSCYKKHPTPNRK